MSLLEYPLEAIDEPALDRLKSDQIAEGKAIEYKSALPAGADRDRIEFLSDVSSFANASGGHIFYGIVEDSGIPVDICGVSDVDPDTWIRRENAESSRQGGLSRATLARMASARRWIRGDSLSRRVGRFWGRVNSPGSKRSLNRSFWSV